MRRNKFSLSHYKLMTGDMGHLLPLTWYDVLPGDTIQQSTSLLIRVSPLLAPVMHPVRVRIHHWFVPWRLIWQDSEDFITGGPDGTDTSVPPYRDSASITESSLRDYLGVPPGTYSPDLRYSVLPLRAYHLIWNEHYRDQDLVSERAVSVLSGSDVATSSTINSVAWEKDYFTTARETESKGDTVNIPLTGDAPITGIGKRNQNYATGPVNVYETDGSGTTAYADYRTASDGHIDAYIDFEEDPNNAGYPNIRADLSAVSGVDINDLRLALSVQRYQEARNKYGSRYTEYLRYLGVSPSDGRLQRPEYLGGGRQVIQFSEVLDHGSAAANVGDLKGHGIAAMKTNRYRRFIPEHGLIMTLGSVVPKTIYTQGLHRSFSKSVKEDYFQKELQHIGDQEILNKEVYTEHASPDDTFGFQERYDEYRYHPSSISGEFHTSLDHWHLGRIFGSDPSLNSTFVTCAPSKRVLASSSTDAMYMMASHSIQARRMLTKRGSGRTL